MKPSEAFINKDAPILDMGDNIKIIRYTFPKAKKDYICEYCAGDINKGDEYSTVTYIDWDNKLKTRRECAECYG